MSSRIPGINKSKPLTVQRDSIGLFLVAKKRKFRAPPEEPSYGKTFLKEGEVTYATNRWWRPVWEDESPEHLEVKTFNEDGCFTFEYWLEEGKPGKELR